MSFSQFAGTAIVPTLSRLVLAAAFITVGYNKLTTTAEFSVDDAELLKNVGVTVKSPDVTEVDAAAASRTVSLASFLQDEPAKETDPPAGEPAKESGGEEPAGYPPLDLAEDVIEVDVPSGDVLQGGTEGAPEGAKPTAAPPSAAPGASTAPSMHKVTLLCAKKNWPQPVALAWMATLTELVGGGLLLIGLFSRIWGLGLAIAMGVAFYLVSMSIMNVHQTNPFEFARNIGNFNTVFSQLGLLVLALGVFLTGPGPLSVDRVLFRRRGKVTMIEGIDDDELAPIGGGRPG